MINLKVPATTANLGPGFDTLGMALPMYNYISMAETDNGLVIEAQGDGALDVPKDATNLVYRAADVVFQAVNYWPSGLKIRSYNNIPMARGLGSSASVIVGGMVAANHISGGKLSNEQILHMATRMEGHPDNVAPALLGGIVVSAQFDDATVYRKIPPPANMTTVVAIPDYELTTKKARDALPTKVPLGDAVYNVSRASLLMWAFINSDMELLG
ncbi:MAG: homoserine kinase, partial [Defluviitaleaceae bacterium]|nr:homoserine kinase [Defluviitaleaceae bacterium]